MNKFNFLQKNNVTYIIIGIFILFALIHLYKINSNITEGFLTTVNDSVKINEADTIYVDMKRESQLRFNNKGLDLILSDKANASDLASKANASDLAAKANASALAITNTDVSTLNTTVSGLSTTVATANTNATNAMTAANNAMPDLSVIAYAGTSVPDGWQLCDGAKLEYKGSISTSIYRFAVNSSGDTINTPDLRGRFILGSNPTTITNTNSDLTISARPFGQLSGQERVTLTKDQMPSHNHNLDGTYLRFGSTWTFANSGYGKLAGGGSTEYEGGGAAHENMPPFYVLTYIIKKPIRPTT